MSNSRESAHRCPKCDADLASNAVLCIHCGYDLKEGRQLTTVVEHARTEEQPGSENPYESPRSDETTEVRADPLDRLEASISRGRLYVCLMIALLIAFSLGAPLLGIVVATVAGGSPMFFQFAVRVLVVSLWCYFLYQGGTFTKWFTVIVLGVFSIANLVMGFSCLFNIGGIVPELPRSVLVVLGVYCAARGIAFGAIAVILVVSPSVDDFRWRQQEEAKSKSLA